MACLRGNQKNFICLFGFSDGKSVKRQRHDCDGSNEMRYTGHDEFFLKMLRQQNYGSHIGTGTHTKFQTFTNNSLVRNRVCIRLPLDNDTTGSTADGEICLGIFPQSTVNGTNRGIQYARPRKGSMSLGYGNDATIRFGISH